MKDKVDYIIVGQGIAGTWLSFELIQRGYSILVINHTTQSTASRKAAGLYNPITGRKWVKTWRADDLFPTLYKRYKALENVIGGSFIHEIPIYRPFRNVSDFNDWESRQSDNLYAQFLKEVKSTSIGIPEIQDEFGGLILNYSGYVDLPGLIDSYHGYLIDKGMYHEEVFDYSEMNANANEITYRNWNAKKIIFCEGPKDSNPYWTDLPFRYVRGETIDIECEMKSDFIINQGVFMIPKTGGFTVGSTYDNEILSYEPQTSGIKNLEDRLTNIYSGNYRIKESRAGIRPATFDRKPFIGFNSKFRTIGIFNGFGTKGVSLTPYFASHFVDVLENKTELEKEVDVQRVA